VVMWTVRTAFQYARNDRESQGGLGSFFSTPLEPAHPLALIQPAKYKDLDSIGILGSQGKFFGVRKVERPIDPTMNVLCFVPLLGNELHRFLPIATIRHAIKQDGG